MGDSNEGEKEIEMRDDHNVVQHFSHKHPLHLSQQQLLDASEIAYCQACEEALMVDSIYYCCIESNCWFYLHKQCAELAMEIKHPFHPHHPLTLTFFSQSPCPPHYSSVCNFCSTICLGFVYHCPSCQFVLDVKCATSKQFLVEYYPISQYGHEHRLIFISNHKDEVKGTSCAACDEALSGPIQGCLGCRFYLHHKCAYLPREIMHPFHLKHPLVLQSQWQVSMLCDFCRKVSDKFVYQCSSCTFSVDVKCVLLSQFRPEHLIKIDHISHDQHPLILIESHNGFDSLCRGCLEPLMLEHNPIFGCFDCKFHLHKSCAKLPYGIEHPYHRKHTLSLLTPYNKHKAECSCPWCKHPTTPEIHQFVYHCNLCNFGYLLKDVLQSLLHKIEDQKHEHPFILVSRPIKFTCDFCGLEGDSNPYLCNECNFLVHKTCISLPSQVTITRHEHPISHINFLQENKIRKWSCRICQQDLDTEYGSYYCFTPGCNYIAHVQCVRDYISDDVIDDDEIMIRGLTTSKSDWEPKSLIVKETAEIGKNGEVVIAEIEHAFHKHKLTLNKDKISSNYTCDGCMRPIFAEAGPSYGCGQCGFNLHKTCAELPRVKPHPLHPHPLTLEKLPDDNEYIIRICSACRRHHHGFSYTCNKERYISYVGGIRRGIEKCNFEIDVECSRLPDLLDHDDHDHECRDRLFLDHKYNGSCSVCPNDISHTHNSLPRGGYRCMRAPQCEFVVCFRCLTLPRTAWYKNDQHPLALTFPAANSYNFDEDEDEDEDDQICCDLCEKAREPGHCFYYCKVCDNSVHPECVVGELPCIKAGLRYFQHQYRTYTFVNNIWDCPPCHRCGSLCFGQALQRYYNGEIFHWRCI